MLVDFEIFTKLLNSLLAQCYYNLIYKVWLSNCKVCFGTQKLDAIYMSAPIIS